jgi:hypothetical protein
MPGRFQAAGRTPHMAKPEAAAPSAIPYRGRLLRRLTWTPLCALKRTSAERANRSDVLYSTSSAAVTLTG